MNILRRRILRVVGGKRQGAPVLLEAGQPGVRDGQQQRVFIVLVQHARTRRADVRHQHRGEGDRQEDDHLVSAGRSGRRLEKSQFCFSTLL